MPPGGQDAKLARQRAQRATARAVREGRPALPKSITGPVRKAQGRASSREKGRQYRRDLNAGLDPEWDPGDADYWAGYGEDS